MSQYCVVCGKGHQLVKLLPRFHSSKSYRYIHVLCVFFFRFDWNERYYVSQSLYSKDHVRSCSVCNLRNHQQVVECAQEQCKRRFHVECARTHQLIYQNPHHEQQNARLLVYCTHHQQGDPIVMLDQTVKELLSEQFLEPGQITHKHKHKKKKSSHHRKHSSSVEGKFSSESPQGRKSSTRVVNQNYQQTILTIRESVITDKIVREAVPKIKSPIKTIPSARKFSSPPKILESVKQQKQIQEDPEFPWSERESKRDQQIAKWWDKISEIYFTPEYLPLTPLEQPQNNLNWWTDTTNPVIQEQNIESIYQIACTTLYKQSLNILYKLNQMNYLVRYQFNTSNNIIDQNNNNNKKLKTNLKIYQSEELIPIKEYPFEMGKYLQPIDYTELSNQEYNELQTIKQKEQQIQEQLENELDGIEPITIHQLDIAYHLLKEDLNNIVQQNNQQKQLINQINQPYDINVIHKKQSLLIDLLKWNQIITAIKNGYHDKSADVLDSYYPVPCGANSQKAFIKKKKLLSKENTKPLETDCKICFDCHYTDINPVVYCEKCSTSFHKICYGLQGPLEDQDVICDGCQYKESARQLTSKKAQVKCGICKKLGLPQKFLKGKFFHIQCLILTNAIHLNQGLFEFKNPLSELKQLCTENQESTPQCAVCGDSKGYRVSCSCSTFVQCRHAFHPLCAYFHGLEIEISSEDLEICCEQLRFANVETHIKCVLHSEKTLTQFVEQTYYRRFALNFEDCAKMGGHENFIEEFKKSKGYRYNKLSKPYRYLSLRQPTSKIDSLQSLIYNQHNGTTTKN